MPYSSPICRTAFTMIDCGWPMTRTLPVKFLRTTASRMSPSIDAVDTHAEHEQVRLVAMQHSSQIAGLTAFAGDEAKILECVRKEQSKVFFAVDDAGARRQLPVPEVTGVHIPAES